jgi:type II secretory pathway component PulF
MPLFTYKARDKTGALHEGTMEGARRDAVADQLSSQGFIPVLIDEKKQPLFQPDLLSGFSKVKPQDLIVFSRQLATLVGSGIPFVMSLATMEQQTQSLSLKKSIGNIRRDLEGGASFSDALAKHPKTFTTLYVSMIRAGETAGVLDDILNRLAMLAEHEADMRARVKAAVRYPLIVVVAICVAFMFLVSFVIPKFAMVYDRFKTELPLPTRILIGINYGMQHYWYLLILGVILLIWGVTWYVSTSRGRWQWDTIKLKLPVFGVLFQKVSLSRFARIFAAMQKSGISMMLTLEIAGEVVGNVVLSKVIAEMRENLSHGKGLVGPMQESGYFPPLVVQMVSVGEETGHLDTMLEKVSDYYDRDVDYTLRNLSTMIEPILLLFVGGMVLFLALGIFLPMWNLLNLFRK